MKLLTQTLRSRCVLAATIALLTVSSQETGRAQQPAGPAPPTPTGAQPPTAPAQPSMPRIAVTAGRSTVLSTDFNVTRIALTNPAVAEATVVAPREILIDGKAPGTISLIVWGDTRRTQYDIVVEQPVAALQQQLQALFPGENIQVSTNEDATVLSGTVSNTGVMLRAGEIATAAATKRKVINLLQVPGGSESQQVLLQVRFAEVNRRALRELGVSLFTSGNGLFDTWGRTSTQQFPAPAFTNLESTKVDGDVVQQSGELTFSDFLNIFFLNAKYDFGAVVRALQASGHFQSLAEPNLIAYNGQEASFLAGGEFPVPVVQGATGTVTIQFKEFGVRLTFTPTIAGDMIRLKVMPEVSTLDFANGVTLGGFRIPALTTRRAQTDVELRDGQSFAIAGLLDNQSQDDTSGIPLLSKLPIVGYLFKSKAERSQQTELMVLITPRLVRPLNPDEVPPLPTKFKSFVPEGGVGKGMDGPGLVDAPAAENGNGARQAPPAKSQK
jgi:pilus assembly protein CpaC